jgi:pimeloyl-ACP methyl ester carboxylesterase
MAFVNVAGSDGASLQIEYVRIPGAGNLPPIIMLHEGLGSVAQWRDFPARLAAATARTVIAYSRKGYGQSDALEPTRHARTPRFMHDEVPVLAALVRAWGIAVPPVLFGHSDGASIALLYAAQHPVAGCVVMAPHVMVEEICVNAIEAASTQFQNDDLRARLAKYHDDVDGAFWGWADVWLLPEFRGWDIRAELTGIRAPLLAIQGEEDEYGTLAQLEAIKAAVPHAKLLKLPGCKHSPQRDAPDIVLSATVSMLAAINPNDAPVDAAAHASGRVTGQTTGQAAGESAADPPYDPADKPLHDGSHA